jgi:sulfite reductase alpha subunit-like flavoprotein
MFIVDVRGVHRSILPYVTARYEVGDHVAVYPSNDKNIVNRIGELLDVDLDQVISLLNVDGKCCFVDAFRTWLIFVSVTCHCRRCTEEESVSMSMQLPYGVNVLLRSD